MRGDQPTLSPCCGTLVSQGPGAPLARQGLPPCVTIPRAATAPGSIPRVTSPWKVPFGRKRTLALETLSQPHTGRTAALVSLLTAPLYSTILMFLCLPILTLEHSPLRDRVQLMSNLHDSQPGGGSVTATIMAPFTELFQQAQCDPKPVTFPVHSQTPLDIPPH